MLNINATLNGEDFKEISVPKEAYSYAYVKTILKSEFTLSTDRDIEIIGT